MKQKIIVCLLLLLPMLWGCGAEPVSNPGIQISLVETDGCTVENNGQWVKPGDSAVFLLRLESGVSLADTDYPGSYTTRTVDGKLELTLENIRYPNRVRLKLTSRYSTISYQPNGGTGTETVKTHDLSHHKRPNTSIGTDLFSRDGYTLTCWNTEPDGSGTRIGLGSRVSAGMKLSLYAQWEKWTDAAQFRWVRTGDGTVTVLEYLGNEETVVIPEQIHGAVVTCIGSNAFVDCPVKRLILPTSMKTVEPGAFVNCDLESVVLFDNIEEISDGSFRNCEQLRTLYINAIEAPYGYAFRKESAYADKVDMLILASGHPKLVFYGGCSTWYNLDGALANKAFGDAFAIINMGLNGTVNSAVQMQIMGHFLEAGDVLLHPLELASAPQLLLETIMDAGDEMLWCGLEYNYDLFSLVDLRTIDGELDSLIYYLQKKKAPTSYQQWYTDEFGRVYMDSYGCVPFERATVREDLGDEVFLNPDYITDEGMEKLAAFYTSYQEQGVTVYASYGCINLDGLTQEERESVDQMDALVKESMGKATSVPVISKLSDYCYVHPDFFDTNYHLRSQVTLDNTVRWIRDLRRQMTADGRIQEREKGQ